MITREEINDFSSDIGSYQQLGLGFTQAYSRVSLQIGTSVARWLHGQNAVNKANLGICFRMGVPVQIELVIQILLVYIAALYRTKVGSLSEYAQQYIDSDIPFFQCSLL